MSVDIFERMRKGESIAMSDPSYSAVREAVSQSLPIIQKINQASDFDEIRELLNQLCLRPIPKSTTIFPPFYTNVGHNLEFGERVFVNHDCSFLDLGGISIGNDVMIGPKVCISSENHPSAPENRNTMVPAKVSIGNNVWIGAQASILPGVSIGDNSVIAAGAVVHKNVAPNTLVGGVPAKTLKHL